MAICCKYCFYTEKEALFDMGADTRMSEDVMETYILKYIEVQPSLEFNLGIFLLRIFSLLNWDDTVKYVTSWA